MASGLMFRCGSPQYVVAPKGTVPNREKLPQDVFGGYVTAKTKNSLTISGELIGMRHDSVFVLGDSIKGIPRDFIKEARIIVHMPNNYKGPGIALMGLSGLVIIQTAEYGSGPLALGLSGILYNGIGLASAQGTEDKKINYYDWSEGWEKVMLYSRFPDGIPVSVQISALRGRN